MDGVQALGNSSAAGAEPSRKRKRPHEAAQDASQKPGSGKGKKAGMSKEQRKAAASVLQVVPSLNASCHSLLSHTIQIRCYFSYCSMQADCTAHMPH